MRGRAALLIAALLLPSGLSAEAPPEPETYRTEEYRAPVPETLEGATVIDNDAALVLWRTGRVGFIDVFPQAPKPANLPEGTLWRDKPRQTIPDALWLPNVGYGRIAGETADYFRAGLRAASGGDTDAPVVIYCLDDCWMSWNAAKRALEWGYTRVFWYPEGTDGWAFYDYPLAETAPFAGG